MERNCGLKELFGKKLAYIRKKKNFSQMKLAELIDSSPTYISQIECGRSNITIDMIKKLANALDVDASELFIF